MLQLRAFATSERVVVASRRLVGAAGVRHLTIGRTTIVREDLPNTTNPDDRARISGKKGERIVFIRTLTAAGQAEEPTADGRSSGSPPASTCNPPPHIWGRFVPGPFVSKILLTIGSGLRVSGVDQCKATRTVSVPCRFSPSTS